MTMHWSIAVILVFVGCCSNVIFLEFLVKEHPGCGTIITFSHFIFIAAEGFLFTSKLGTVAPKIPIKKYVTMVLIFFAVQLSNNLAFSCNISVPLHTIFRSGTLFTNMLLGVLLQNKRYDKTKYLSVMLVTVGIVIYTLASKLEAMQPTETVAGDSSIGLVRWLSGLGLLLFALFMTAGMGIYQETVFKKHGKHPTEALFYNHALPLPCFILVATSVYDYAVLFNQSEPYVIPLLGLACPKMWLYLAGNVITQYVCIRGVFILSTECASLTVTFILTLRKFLSLCFSILYFSNPFTTTHWLGTILVFFGTLMFIDVLSILRRLVRPTGKIKAQ